MLIDQMSKLVHIQDKAKYILENYPKSRNSREEFTQAYVRHFNPFRRQETVGKAILEVESALRAQRTIQNSWKLYPPTEKVDDMRQEASKAHAIVFGE